MHPHAHCINQSFSRMNSPLIILYDLPQKHASHKHLHLSHWLNLGKQSQRVVTSRFSLKVWLILAIVQGLGQYQSGYGSSRVKALHHLHLLGLNLQVNVPNQGLYVQHHNSDIHESSCPQH